MSVKLPEFLLSPTPDIYLTNKYAIVDLETTIREADNEVLVAVVKSAGSTCRYTFSNIYGLGDFCDCLASYSYIVGHNIKFDLKFLQKAGLNLYNIVVFDTQIAEYVINSNRKLPLDLGSVSVRHGGPQKRPYIAELMENKQCPSTYDQRLLLNRCALDVHQTELVFLKQREILKKKGLLPTIYTRCLLTPVLASIEEEGMVLDDAKVNQQYTDTMEEYRKVDDEIQKFTGGINPRSSKQVAEYLYEKLKFPELKVPWSGESKRTPAGGRLTDKDSILLLDAKTPEQKIFKELKYKQSVLSADLDKALSKFKECCSNKDILTAQFNQTVTATQRLSSTGKKYGVQFQNLHRKFKPLIKARDGYLIGEADGAQLEFRVAAFLGNDEVAKKDIVNDVDVHMSTSDILTKSGQPTNRQDAKEHTFKPLYGGESGTKAEQTYYRYFNDRYKGISTVQLKWLDEVIKTKELRTKTGLIFYWPDTTITRSGYVTNKQSIYNYPVQSFATADIIPIALVYAYHLLKGSGIRIVNTVHDSIVAEIPLDKIWLFAEVMADAFTKWVYFYLREVYKIYFDVPLAAGIKIGTHWGTSDRGVMSNLYEKLDKTYFKLKKEEEIVYTRSIHEYSW